MKRIFQIAQRLPVVLRPNKVRVGMDLGSSTTRLRVGSSLRLQQPSTVIVYAGEGTIVAVGKKAQQFQSSAHRHTLFRRPVEKGIIADIGLAQDYIRTTMSEAVANNNLPLVTSIEGVCLVPSVFSQVERHIFRQALSTLGLGSWQLKQKAMVWQDVFQRKDEYGACVDLGGDTTEVILIDGDQTVWAETIAMGGRHLIQRLIESIRIQQGLHISWQSGEQLLQEMNVESGGVDTGNKVTIRGKQIATGKPVTVTLQVSSFQPLLVQFFEELFSFIDIFFARVPTQLLTNCLEKKVLLSGGVSQLQGIDSFFSTTLDTTCVLSDQPHTDLIKHLW